MAKFGWSCIIKCTTANTVVQTSNTLEEKRKDGEIAECFKLFISTFNPPKTATTSLRQTPEFLSFVSKKTALYPKKKNIAHCTRQRGTTVAEPVVISSVRMVSTVFT